MSTTVAFMIEDEKRYNGTKSQLENTYHYHGLSVVVPMSLALVVFIILSVMGNLMVIVTVLRHKEMRTRTNMFLVNLAVADLLTAVIDMPISLVTMIHGDWVLGEFFCKLNGFTMALLLICSIHTLMYISIYKYVSITRPFSQVMTHQRILLMIVVTWGWSAVCATFPLLGWNKIIYKKGSSQCGPGLPKSWKDRSHSILITFSNYVIPLAVMIFCYFWIFKEIHSHIQRMRETSNIPVEDTIFQQKRVSMTLVLVLSCFLICWTPYVLYSTTVAFIQDKSKVPLVINPIAYWCGYMNSACNPIIYAFKTPSLRQGYKEMMCGRMSFQERFPIQLLTREEEEDKQFLSRFTWISLLLLCFIRKRLDNHSLRAAEEFQEVPVRTNLNTPDLSVQNMRSSIHLQPSNEERREKHTDTG
ncbi:alpha-2Db adrenergic receptor-like [Limulus polyphemus]|uniref:Alpha-2Db adrenergic receptor-like n=1 Tax=Limulus polyphemus TaxID=6850 RepID=A0ABM1BQD3_LIMPO|nr:alpha-2Db adrenergic receptor-like [Limulus polyphemus]